YFIFFFQAEDGIRDRNVTGVQTCALPILKRYDLDPKKKTVLIFGGSQGALKINQAVVAAIPTFSKKNYQLLYVSGERYYEEIERSEERRVGKESRKRR